MLNKTETNGGDDLPHHHHIVIGDILLHSESKILTIPVIINLLSPTSSSTIAKPIIRRLTPNSSGTNGSQTIIPSDLKNTASVKVNSERRRTSLSSKKKFLRMHKAGLALVKEFKSKVISLNHNDLKSVNTNTNDQRTHL